MTLDGPAPALGVTGHRRLCHADATALPDLLDTVLDGLGPAGTLVSSLAEGSDRVAAGRALARPGWRLHVVLPLAADDYRRDFADAVSCAAFDALLAAAVAVEQVDDPRSREEGYRAAGRRMLELSDAIVAVWDGLPARGVGGTAEIVAEARARGLPLALITVGAAGTADAVDGPRLELERWPWAS